MVSIAAKLNNYSFKQNQYYEYILDIAYVSTHKLIKILDIYKKSWYIRPYYFVPFMCDLV